MRNDLKGVFASGRILLGDGGMGTGLSEYRRDVRLPEEFNFLYPQDVVSLGAAFINAGSDLISTNTFGANPIRLSEYGLDSECNELNLRGAELAREAAGDDCWVIGSVGPTGKTLLMGDVTQGEVIDGYSLQIKALAKGGVDAICIETMSDIEEATLAVKAAKESIDLPIFCTFTFEGIKSGEFRTMMGVSPEQYVEVMRSFELTLLGCNCGNGSPGTLEIVRLLRGADDTIALMAQSNAGMPLLEAGEVVYPEKPEDMAAVVTDFVKAGVTLIGGCCGTTPDHIKAMRKETDTFCECKRKII